MEKDICLCDLVFDYYEKQILFGYCQYGERLPSITHICDLFHLSRNTVRKAYERLKEKGYAQSEERKGFTVLYRGSSEDFERNKANYYVPREDGIQDFLCAAKLLFAPLGKLEDQDRGTAKREALYQKRFEKLVDSTSSAVMFCIENISPIQNGLLTNLYLECLRYVNFLYSDQPEGGWYIDTKKEVSEFISSMKEKYHLEQAEQIPFKWNIYRQRPQVRYTLATVILREILCGRYPPDSFLPSLQKMAEEYHVSLTTVRRTVATLNSFGVTKSYHGSGTKISIDPTLVDFTSSDIQESLQMSKESMQLLKLTIHNVLLYTLENASKETLEKLERNFSAILDNNKGILCMNVIVDFICQECPSAMVRECYTRLWEYVIWGYIFVLPLLKSDEFNTRYTKVISQMVSHLQDDDLPAFADDWRTVMELAVRGIFDLTKASAVI